MFLTGLGTAVPPQRFTQMECWAALQQSSQFPQLNARSRALLTKVLSGKNGIANRDLAVADWEEAFVLTPDALHARFARHAPALATQAAERALGHARLRPAEVLERALAASAPGGWWWLSSFGAGFSCHGALLKVD
jgi:alkylresorcinol/alkylpyrone synthase